MLRLEIADLFCGAGGTSTGACEAVRAAGYEPALTAVNHWPRAIATHQANHPAAAHLCASVDDVDPRRLYRFGQLHLLWASPECTGHSRARGGKPSSDQSRATGHCVTRWAEALQPPVILVENVPEFLDWGPLDTRGQPLKSRRGETFKAWVGMLRALGYQVEWRILCAADYGDPTTRKRLFIQAVRGRRQIVWPHRTHASTAELADLATNPDLFGPGKLEIGNCKLRPWRAARECIDWTHKGRWLDEMPAKQQYGGLPLSPKTLRRIHAGLRKYGLAKIPNSEFRIPNSPAARHGVVEPYLVELRGTGPDQLDRSARPLDTPLGAVTAGGGHHGLITPFLVPTGFSERDGQKPRTHSLAEPLPTAVGTGKHALIEPALLPTSETAFLLGQHSCAALRPVSEPSPTVTCDGAIALVEPHLIPHSAFRTPQSLEPHLVKFYGTATAADLGEPLDTVTTKERFGLVEAELLELTRTLPHVAGRRPDVLAQILPVVEINGRRHRVRLRWRMLQPAELSLAQGFPRGYRFTGTKTEAVKQIGNAVPRHLARALVFAALTQNPDVSALWPR